MKLRIALTQNFDRTKWIICYLPFSRRKCNSLLGEEHSEDVQRARGEFTHPPGAAGLWHHGQASAVSKLAFNVAANFFPQVLKERRENRVTTLELSSTFLPQANRNKLLQYILGFTLL